MKKITLLSIFSLFVLSACNYSTKDDASYPVDDISVDTNISSQYNYKGKTFQWAGNVTAIVDADGKWSAPTFDLETFAKTSITNELTGHGLVETKTSKDILIAFGIGFDTAALKFRSGPKHKKMRKKISAGALAVVIVNKKTNQVLWMATAEGEYKKLSADVAQKRVQYAISEMFKKFPE